MNVIEKMNELVGASATKEEIKKWAYMNRETVVGVWCDYPFNSLEKTVNKFIEEQDYHGMEDEHEAWEKFLDFEYVDGETNKGGV